ncbi:MAG: M48 family metallopeptidase [Betaproteobacteria bacterium]
MNEDRATRYQRLKRRVAVISLGWSVALLVALLVTGWTFALRGGAAAAAAAIAGPGAAPWLTVVFYVLILLLVSEIGSLPLGFYSGFLLERRYGLSTERLSGWALDTLKSFAVGLVLGGAAATIVYALIRRSPGGWWLSGGLIFAALIVGLANVAPVLLIPIFYRLKPLERESLRQRLFALAERAGARVLAAHEWGLGDKTRKANAALVGIGSTRRILVSDTMLAQYSDDEIEVVLAHELAHHVHGDIWKGIALESALVVAGFYLASRVLTALAGPAGLTSVADPAGMPLLVLAAGAVSLIMAPVALAMSRAFERSADRFALALTRNPGAFVSAMRRLAAQNLAEEHPSRAVQWLFYSHPPIRERIAAAEAFEP